MKRSFYFIRHGITNFNQEKRYTGHKNIPIICSNYQEIINLSYLIKKMNIVMIYSSPLLRAQQTANIISNRLNIPLVFINEFKERSFGIYEGKKKLRYNKNFFPKGQSLHSYNKQVLRGLKKIRTKKNILIVAHSGVYKILVKKCCGHIPKRSIKNNELVYFDFNSKKIISFI